MSAAPLPVKVVGEDGSIIPPPHLETAPWADEEGLAFADYKTGRARVLTPDKRAALTFRCLPLPSAVAGLIEAHPKEVPEIFSCTKKKHLGCEIDNVLLETHVRKLR